MGNDGPKITWDVDKVDAGFQNSGEDFLLVLKLPKEMLQLKGRREIEDCIAESTHELATSLRDAWIEAQEPAES